MNKKGILLINLGTPDSPSVPDVRKYLDEFLMDGRVIDIPLINRALLVRGIIVPFRSPKTSKLYQKIWDEKKGSPLLHISETQRYLLQERMGDDHIVELAMRYQNPSIEYALDRLRSAGVSSIRVLPLFPQYASATTGSVIQKVMEYVCKWPVIPPISFVNSFHDHGKMIRVFAEKGREHRPETYDHVLFSFHGLPERQMFKSAYPPRQMSREESLSFGLGDNNRFSYMAQCGDTARLIAEQLNIPASGYSICFQSRLGKEPWIQPYTSDTLKKLAAEGKKRLLVFSPAFVADCLETLYEIAFEYQEEFQALGGEHVQLVESLNDHPLWIEAMEDMARG